MKKGVQMYAIKALTKESMDKALATVAEIGYDGVEFAGFFGHSANEIKEMLDKYHLQALGAHIDADLIFDHIEETIEFHKTIGNNRIICPGRPVENKEQVIELANRYKDVADEYKKAGMKLFYHNHAHEFVKDGDEYLIDILAENVPRDVLSLEFDVYWVYRGLECPVKYMKKYADRIEVFHAKDGILEVPATLGEGEVDMKAVFDFAIENNMAWAVAECEGEDNIESQVDAIRADYVAMCKFMA